MAEDKLLEEFFKQDRWEKAIQVALDKRIDKAELRALTLPQTRLRLLSAIENDAYEIAPPHQAAIPKDNGDFRIVYVNENIDRIFLSIVNDILFDFCKTMIHKSCKSYQSGIGCGNVVKEAVKEISKCHNNTIGMKLDLTKYFDTVPIKYIDETFQKIEQITGKSKVLDIVKKYYHSDLCFDLDGNIVEKYQSLKQGCAVASFLADSILFDMDNNASKMDVYYIRYSDDILIIGENYSKCFEFVQKTLNDMGLTLNPKKVELLSKDIWFKFLGFNIRGNQITLSKNRVKSFQKEIEDRTIKKNIGLAGAVSSVNNYLYKGNGSYSWATSVLRVVNVDKDIEQLNNFVMDALRACETKKKKIGGLGVVLNKEDHTILRGVGKNVRSNRNKTKKEIDGYLSINCMKNAMNISLEVFNALAMSI